MRGPRGWPRKGARVLHMAARPLPALRSLPAPVLGLLPLPHTCLSMDPAGPRSPTRDLRTLDPGALTRGPAPRGFNVNSSKAGCLGVGTVCHSLRVGWLGPSPVTLHGDSVMDVWSWKKSGERSAAARTEDAGGRQAGAAREGRS